MAMVMPVSVLRRRLLGGWGWRNVRKIGSDFAIGEGSIMMLLEMFKSRTILMVLTLLAVTIGINVWSAQNPNPVTELARTNDEKLAIYLEQYRAAQLEYRKTHSGFAQDVRELGASGLSPQDRDVRLEVRKADMNVYCVIAEHSRGMTWFRASNLGVLRLAARSQPAPTACD
jgi:hypothetical protein